MEIYIISRRHLCHRRFCINSKTGSSLKGLNLLPLGAFLSFSSRPLFKRFLVCRKANRKTQKVDYLVKIAESLPSVTSHLKSKYYNPADKQRWNNVNSRSRINVDSNTPRLYSQWLNSVIYYAINHWAETRDAIWRLSNVISTRCWRQS